MWRKKCKKILSGRHSQGQKGQKVPENVAEPIDDLEDEFETDDSMSETEQEQPETSENMPVFNIRNYVKSIYPFEEITDEFNWAKKHEK